MKKVILFGAGELGREALFFYGDENVYAFCDNNVALSGSQLSGKPILSYSEFLNLWKNFKIVVSVGLDDSVREISAQLRADSIDFSLFIEEKRREKNKAIFTDTSIRETRP